MDGTLSPTRGSQGHGHARRPAEGFENRLGDVVGVDAVQIVDVQRHMGGIDETLEELVHQIHVEVADASPGILDPVLETGPAGEVDHHPGQGLVQRDVSVTVTGDALLVAQRVREGLAEDDTDVLHRVVGVDVQITPGLHFDIEQPVARHLVEHVFEKGQSGLEAPLAGAVEIQR